MIDSPRRRPHGARGAAALRPAGRTTPRTPRRAPRLGALAIAAAVGAASLAAPVAAPLHAQLTVDELELFLTPGSADAVRVFQVRNDGDAPLQAQVLLGDWDRALDGSNRFFEAGTQANSCHDRLTVFPRSLRLEPGAEGTVRVSLAPDDSGADAPCWSIVFVENPAVAARGGRQLVYTIRTGVKVYGEPSGARRDGAVVAMAFADGDAASPDDAADASAPGSAAPAPADAAPDPGARPLAVHFRNFGTAQLRVAGAVEVRRVDNTLVERLPFDAFPVLPDAERRVLVDVPALPVGRYLLLALLDFGGDEIAAGQLEYEVR